MALLQGVDPWRISQEEMGKYSHQFMAMKPQGGFVTGEQARNFMLLSQLPPPILAQIWALADVNGDGKMDRAEFVIACKLIQEKCKGLEVPKMLPPGLQMLLMAPAAPSGMSQPPVSAPQAMVTQPHMGGPPPIPPQPQVAAAGPPGRPMRPPSPNLANKVQRSGSTTAQDLSLQEWAIPHQSKLKYTQLFNSFDKARTGFITGVQVRPLLVQSGLPQAALAQIWALSDLDNDGRLSCEEFCVTLHLIECVKAGDKLPAVLPADLIPPSFRKKRTLSTGSSGGGAAPAGGVQQEGGGDMCVDKRDDKMLQQTTFEDKRRENFEKGQAELEKRRQALLEIQQKEKEERERKEKEEFDRKERIRLEQERRRQMEMEKQLAKQREIEQEKEEQRRKQMEQREAARREMERQRQLEWEKSRRQELMNQRQKEQEKVLQLKAKNQSMTIELGQLNDKVKELTEKAVEARQNVQTVKGSIDQMRLIRDSRLNELELFKREIREQNQRLILINQEKQQITETLKINAINNPTAESHNVVMHSFNNKQITLQQLRDKLESVDNEMKQKISDIDNNNSQLDELKTQMDTLITSGQQLYEIYKQKREKVLEIKRQREATKAPPRPPMPTDWGTTGDAWAEDPAAAWGKAGEEQTAWATEPVAVADNWERTDAAWDQPAGWPSGDVRYRALYAFEARNEDELSIMPGDIINGIPDSTVEAGWLKGEFQGKAGWFPETYVEALDTSTSVEPSAGGSGVHTPTSAVAVQETVTIMGTEVKMLSGIQETPENVSIDAVPYQETSQSSHPAAEVPLEPTSAVAVFAWRARKENHLSFSKGDVIQVREQQDAWWFGENAASNQSGWFPKNYVRLSTQGSGAGTPTSLGGADITSPPQDYFVSMYAYQSAEPGDLCFDFGDVIMVTKMEGDWWTGIIGDRHGLFPSNYVRKLEPHELAETIGQEALAAEFESKVDINGQENSVEVLPTASPPNTIEAVQPEPKIQTPEDPEPLYEVIPDTVGSGEAEPEPTPKSTKKQDIVQVIAPYASSGPEQLTLTRGQLIAVRKRAPSGWWEGELQAKGKKRQIGWFPASYVRQLEGTGSSSARSTPEPGQHQKDLGGANGGTTPVPPVEKVVALYPYTAQNDDELTFQKGSVIVVLSKDDASWWKGDCDGSVGMFPANYVQTVEAAGGQSGVDMFAFEPAARGSSTRGDRLSRVDELISTERQYVEDLTVVLEVFANPMRESKVCSEEELNAIFVNWTEIVLCNHKLLKAFRVRKKMSDHGVIEMMGDILCENLPCMTPYMRFCSCQLSAAALIQTKTDNNAEFVQIMKQCVQDPRAKGMPLSSFLLKPMQRITKYPLLIQKVLENTPAHHPDRANLEEALVKAEELCSQVNEAVRERENSDSLEWMQRHINLDGLIEITFNSLTNSLGPRKFVYSGIMYKAKSGKELAVFLCSDFLLLTQPVKTSTLTSSHRNSTHFPAHDIKSNKNFYKLYKKPFFLKHIIIMSAADDDCVFQVSCGSKPDSVELGNTLPVLLRTTSANQRVTWIKEIESAAKVCIELDKNYAEKQMKAKLQMSRAVGRLLVMVLDGMDLQAKTTGRCDAYCVVSMGSQEHRTKIVMDSTSPVWNDSMQFLIRDLQEDVLCLTVFDRDYFSPNNFLGRTEVRVADIARQTRQTPILLKLKLYEVETGEVTLKIDLHLFNSVSEKLKNLM